MKLPSLLDFPVASRKILVRVDFNVPVDAGNLRDDTRIRRSLPTIQYLLEKGATVILASHFGRPKGIPHEELRLDRVARRLAKLLQSPVVKLDEIVGESVKHSIRQIRKGEVMLLENLRFDSREELGDEGFALELASLADGFVNDAFSVCHRLHASVSGVARHLPSCAGFLLQDEITHLLPLRQSPKRPFRVVMGGKKIVDKIPLLKTLLFKADRILIGGGIASTFLNAFGIHPGRSPWEAPALETAKEILRLAESSNCQILLPSDGVAVHSDTGEVLGAFPVTHFPPEGVMKDIGPETASRYQMALKGAQTLFWNGPLGVFEESPLEKGSLQVLDAVGALPAYRVAGGGETLDLLRHTGTSSYFDFISTGGGATLAFLAEEPMPGLVALEKML